MDSVDLGVAYRYLGDARRLFGARLRSTRPDAVEAFVERWRAQLARADAGAKRIDDETFEANIGITNDGPDRWGPL